MSYYQQPVYRIDEFIDRAQKRAKGINLADQRTTTHAELTLIEHHCRQRHQAGLRLLEDVSTEEVQQCRLLFTHPQTIDLGSDPDALIELHIDDTAVIVPAYCAFLKLARALQAVYSLNPEPVG